MYTLKSEIDHDSTFAVAGGTTGCRNDNLWCRQWRQNWHHDNSRCFSSSVILGMNDIYQSSHKEIVLVFHSLLHFAVARYSSNLPMSLMGHDFVQEYWQVSH